MLPRRSVRVHRPGYAPRRGAHGPVPDAPDGQRCRTAPLRGVPRAARRRVRRVPLGRLGPRRTERPRRGRGRLRRHASRARTARARGEGRSPPLRPSDADVVADRALGYAPSRRGPVPPGERRDALARARPAGAAGLGRVAPELRVRRGVPRRGLRSRRAPRRAGGHRDRPRRPHPAVAARPRDHAHLATTGAPVRLARHGCGLACLGFHVEIRTPLRLRFDEEDKKLVELSSDQAWSWRS